jgi:hypothetical protein
MRRHYGLPARRGVALAPTENSPAYGLLVRSPGSHSPTGAPWVARCMRKVSASFGGSDGEARLDESVSIGPFALGVADRAHAARVLRAEQRRGCATLVSSAPTIIGPIIDDFRRLPLSTGLSSNSVFRRRLSATRAGATRSWDCHRTATKGWRANNDTGDFPWYRGCNCRRRELERNHRWWRPRSPSCGRRRRRQRISARSRRGDSSPHVLRAGRRASEREEGQQSSDAIAADRTDVDMVTNSGAAGLKTLIK